MRTLCVAALQCAPVARDPGATLELLRNRAAGVRAVAPATQLLLLPELHLPAPPPLLEESRGYMESVAVEIPGALTDALAEIAREVGLWLVPGSVWERGEEGDVHNTALAFSPEGELVARYRKVFPWQPHEHTTPGHEFVTFDIPDVGRIGLAICYDGAFPETYRQLAWMGAEAVLQPTLTPTADRDAERVMARANAIFNQLYIISLNAAQPAALGRSLIVDPEGLVRQSAGEGEELLTDVLDLDAVTRVREFGTAGVSRMWEQASRQLPGLDLPVYGVRAAGSPAPHTAN
jgi:formamidase